MGVKACNRTNCENIMCDTYIPTIGYVCLECENEFKEYVMSRLTVSNSFEIKTLFTVFLETEKGKYTDKPISVDEWFNLYR